MKHVRWKSVKKCGETRARVSDVLIALFAAVIIIGFVWALARGAVFCHAMGCASEAWRW